MDSMIKSINVNNNQFIFDGRTLEFYEMLDNNEFLKLKNTDIDTPFEREYENSDILMTLTLNMSNTCNLKCRYCYANGGNYKRDNNLMDKHSLNKIILDLRKKNIKKIREIKFFGGEPLLNFSLIKHALTEFNNLFEVKKYIIVTNGTLLTDEIIKMCVNNNCYFAISLDGPKEINDFLRGENITDIVLKNLNIINPIYKKFITILCTYTPYHLEKGYTRKKISNFFETLGYQYNISKVVSNIKEFNFSSEKCTKELFNDIDNSFDIILNNTLGKTINATVYEFIFAIAFNIKTYSFCDELNENVNLSYDFNGDKYICYRFWGMKKYNLSNNEYKKNYDLINNKKHTNKCKNCWARYMCKICPANIINDYIQNDFGINNDNCSKLNQFEYILEKFIKLFELNKMNLLIDNFQNFIKIT